MADIDDLFDGEEEQGNQKTPKDEDADRAWATMRRKLDKLEKEAQELRAYKVEVETKQRTASVADAFTALGLKPKHAEFYPADAPTEPDAIKAWAVDKELLALEEGEEVTEVTTSPQSTGFTPTAVGEGAPLGSKRYSFEEWEKLLASDPNRAMQVWNAGRVERESSPGGTMFAGRDR